MADMKGKTSRIYLVDGTPTGVLTAEIINWAGKVIVAPRPRLAELASRPPTASMPSLAAAKPARSNRFLGVVGQRSAR